MLQNQNTDVKSHTSLGTAFPQTLCSYLDFLQNTSITWNAI